MNKELIQYVRYQKGRRKGQPFACFVATSKDNVGWSRCSRKDVFSKDKAKMIAFGRASKGLEHNLKTVHPSIKKEFQQFVERCKRYYK